MEVLCVAEKPSIAKSVANILSGGRYQTRQTGEKYIRNYIFDYPQTNSQFTVTSVSGHIMGHDFDEVYKSWRSVDPLQLFTLPVRCNVDKEKVKIKENLQQLARTANTLMIWTDCDREGENIGYEIMQVCREVKANITVNRARFSAIIQNQIHRAAQRPVELDMAQAYAVEARSILDLRIGAAFTRMQSLTLQSTVAVEGVVSYGPCQFPTLGFVVARYCEARAFTEEPFWYITLLLTRQVGGHPKETAFSWRRNHLFNFDDVFVIYERIMAIDNARARITKVTKKTTKKYKPLPLTTVELQKAGSRLLKLAPKKVLDVAEKLYQDGFLSYPRTETDQYDPQFDFMALIEKQTADSAWGTFARGKGKHNDKAHPPIHPTAHAANLTGDQKKVYEYITRRFLASCSKDAEGFETKAEVDYGGELFSASGLSVLRRNYLEVYPYDKWSDKDMPDFVEGETFEPTSCEVKEGKTSAPSLLTEADLVTLMDKNGIGTDATIAQHIDTIVTRKYVTEIKEGSTKYLAPSPLGLGLIGGYNQIGLERSLSKPQLRRETERHLVQICEGTKTKEEMLEQSVALYQEMFILARREFNKVITVKGAPIPRRGAGGGGDGDGGGGGGGGGGYDEGGDGDGGGRGGPARRGRGSGTGRARGRGRGRNSTGNDAPDDGTKKKRGRPRKNPPPDAPAAPAAPATLSRGQVAPSHVSSEDYGFDGAFLNRRL
ncbi:prokaryotic type I DNA topoisomerase [Coniophora puteana RWD-64-598 SS2]|uniref:DNA topoisomerase n=1 Tax=Coniophora puteana (strain RWD-64-598) TaxID=741705 RepID=A0A5M3MUJ5_CONPW|nr:prokaryotic type I DNA topoisomerase [Coniophora puteana RWD-64-598 SS2]EIW82848.1 prokaryotic type I DNA topoisomerase [Coniophora puteana RWD-64-598 SS2]